MFFSSYLNTNYINISNEIPLGCAFTVIAIEPKTWCITYGISCKENNNTLIYSEASNKLMLILLDNYCMNLIKRILHAMSFYINFYQTLVQEYTYYIYLWRAY